MKKRVEISDAAKEDLRNIYHYSFNQFGESVADRYFEKINDVITFLQVHETGIKRDDIINGIYVIPVGKHIIFYMNEDDIIVIIRILHQTQDFSRHLQ